MTTEKTARRMSPKGFLAKCNSKAGLSVMAFVKAHNEYLTQGEVAYATAPIVEQLIEGNIMNTPAMDAIKKAVMDHILKVDSMSFEEKQEKAAEKAKAEGKPARIAKALKPFSACIRDGSGNVLVNDEGKEVKATFDLPQRASEWCDRRLFEQTPDCFGEVFHRNAHYEFVNRDGAIGRILKGKGSAVMKHQASAGSLSFGTKVKESHSKFSHG